MLSGHLWAMYRGGGLRSLWSRLPGQVGALCCPQDGRGLAPEGGRMDPGREKCTKVHLLSLEKPVRYCPS